MKRSSLRNLSVLIGLLIFAIGLGYSASGAALAQADETLSPLPLPSTLPLDEYETLLFDFLESKTYQEMGWAEDKRVRDTGAYIDGAYYGTHPAVRIFYSPEVYAWLKNDRTGVIPDGAMIIKEMYAPPAARYADLTDDEINAQLSMWTYIIRDSSASKDGWFWGYHDTGEAVDGNAYPFNYPDAGFGQYCVRCHASAANEFTFSALRNIAGEPGNPVSYRVDNSWIDPSAAQTPSGQHDALAADVDGASLAEVKPARDLNPEFLALFDMIAPVEPGAVASIPPVTYDHVVAGPDGPEQFITSDQCLSCHSGQDLPFGPNMIIPATDDQELVNLSPYGEWNWSMMGLAGRDPIFHAQLESEISMHSSGDLPQTIQNLCFQCHGVMGQRQFHIDDAGEYFTRDILDVVDPTDPLHKYGALARDGISCTVCHQIDVTEETPLHEIMTGQFPVSTPGEEEPGISRIFGPFEDPATLPMVASLGMKPEYNATIKSSKICASCHTIYLPIYDADGNQVGSDFEQTTYLEWQNSAYQDEFGGGSDPKTCQDCHMPNEYEGEALAFRIANIQDQTYPEADNRALEAEVTVPIREDFARHTLLGINIFGLEMFNQFDDVLGVRKTDFMTGSDNGLPTAIEVSNRLAKEESATVEIERVEVNDGQLEVDVRVTNLTGHRFPSGVGFRRAFLELQVVDQSNLVHWASGRTNSLGVIVDGNGTPLPSEFLTILNPAACAADPTTCEQAYEPHYETITDEDQVLIYQELVKNPENLFTTSFVAQATTIKDNRLLPKGWTPEGPPGFAADPEWGEKYVIATAPKGNVVDDRGFQDGTGSDIVTYQITLPSAMEDLTGSQVIARLYYQSIPPFYLMERFMAADGASAERLHYLSSRLNLDGTPIENWKLEIASAASDLLAAE